jgi:hypothetical protein
VLIIPSSWGSQLGGHPARIKLIFWRGCRGKRRLLQGEFHTHILYFVLVLLYFIFACIVFIKNTKNLVSFIVVTYLLLVHYVVPKYVLEDLSVGSGSIIAKSNIEEFF